MSANSNKDSMWKALNDVINIFTGEDMENMWLVIFYYKTHYKINI